MASTTRRLGHELHGSEYEVQYLDFESGRTTEVLRRSGLLSHQWLAVSPDDEWILYGEHPEAQSELMLVENFR